MSTISLDQLYELIPQMCKGDILAFLGVRRFFEEHELSEMRWEDENGERLMVLHFSKNFIFEVMANLGGDTMFSFPSEESYIGKELSKVVDNTGLFLKSYFITQKPLSECWGFINKAIYLYYNLLHQINEHARVSDLLDLEEFEPQEERYESNF